MPLITTQNITLYTHIGDILAIPLFLLGFLYFYSIGRVRVRTWTETVLMVFCLLGFIADSIFTMNYLFRM